MDSIRPLFTKNSPLALIALGVVVGVGGAFGAALFHTLIALTTQLFYGHDGSGSFIDIVSGLPTWQRVLIPTLGGLLVGVIFHLMKVSEAEGEGVPEVMEALAERRGAIRPLVAPVKIVTAALTLGSGGSAGREGPVIQIGSSIGSTIGQLTKQNTVDRSLLLAAGAAAAIGGTFGAPIAGLLFTVEILHHKTTDIIRACVIVSAAFIGGAVTKLLIHHDGLRFPLPGDMGLTLGNGIALFLMGIIAAGAALLFGKVLDLSRSSFKKIPLPLFIRPALGGFFIGLIGLYLPYIHEPAAYPLMINLLALSSLPVALLALLLVVKMIATGITLGSGGSGGIFAPLLLMGAICGSVLASTLIILHLPGLSVGHIVVLGMAAMFAAAAHAPLTAAFITFEMTGGNITFLLPLLLVCFIATYTAKRISHKSVYSLHQ